VLFQLVGEAYCLFVLYIVQFSVVPGSSVCHNFKNFQFYVVNSSVVPGSVMAAPYSGGTILFLPLLYHWGSILVYH